MRGRSWLRVQQWLRGGSMLRVQFRLRRGSWLRLRQRLRIFVLQAGRIVESPVWQPIVLLWYIELLRAGMRMRFGLCRCRLLRGSELRRSGWLLWQWICRTELWRSGWLLWQWLCGSGRKPSGSGHRRATCPADTRRPCGSG
jgi:hypothetical protein